MSSSLKRIVIEKETHARSDRCYKIKKKCHPSLSKNTSRHNYVVLGYLWESRISPFPPKNHLQLFQANVMS